MNQSTLNCLRRVITRGLSTRRWDGPQVSGKILWKKNIYRDVIANIWYRYHFSRYASKYPLNTIFIAALPKSGTTWLQNMLSDLPGFLPIWPPYVRKRLVQSWYGEIENFSVWDLQSGLYDYYKDKLAVVKLHTRPSPTNISIIRELNTPIILMYRDLRDVCVSWYFFVRDITPIHSRKDAIQGLTPEEGISFFIENLLEDYTLWIKGWRNAQNIQIIEIRYEDLLSDPEGALTKILGDLGIHVDRDIIKQIITKHAFNRNQSRSFLNPEPRSNKRSGKTGNWKSYFHDSHRNRFKHIAGDILIELGFERNMDW